MRAPFVKLCLYLLAVPTLGQVAFVDDDNCPGPGTGTDLDPYCTIQSAICALDASGGGTVRVRPGTYFEAIRIFPGVSVESTDGPSVTFINATGKPCVDATCNVLASPPRCSTVTFDVGTTTADRIEGFRITGGAGTDVGVGTDPATVGGGIYIADGSPTITANEIFGNVLSGSRRKQKGGGIFAGGGTQEAPVSPVITVNLIESNVASTPGPPAGGGYPGFPSAIGGGLATGPYSSPHVEGNTFRRNRAAPAAISSGGAIILYSFSDAIVPRVSRNLITENMAEDFGGGAVFSYAFGGGIFLPGFGTFDNNVVELNAANLGGGLAMGTTQIDLYNNTIVENTANASGGGIAFLGVQNPADQANAVNNILAFNTSSAGGGVFVDLNPSGGASPPEPTLADNVLFGNVPNNTNVASIIGAAGNFASDPELISLDPVSRNLRLRTSSPAIDAGDDTVAAAVDFDGDPRIEGSAIDIGAFEFVFVDADGDGVSDDEDNCPATPNAGQSNADGDAFGDACDTCVGDPDNDADADGICGDVDNCPATANAGQLNGDGDAFGDACDSCPLDPEDDLDADGLCGDVDPCPNDADNDADSDGLCGDVDPCPLDAADDLDSDGVCGDVDNCPDVANPGQEDTDMNGTGDACEQGTVDVDMDGIPDTSDNCPTTPNAGQLDTEGDGAGDACDDDDDGDGALDVADCAALVPGVSLLPDPVGATLELAAGAATQLTWMRGAQSPVFNVYRGSFTAGAFAYNEACLVAETVTTTAGDVQNPAPGEVQLYLVGSRNVCGDSDLGTDSASAVRPLGVACGTNGADTDGDTVPDLEDNCPAAANADQADTDGDFVGDVCDAARGPGQ